MDLALSMLLIWAILFVPIGIVIHGLVLGASARVRALPLAPITGIAVALVVMATLGRIGVEGGNTYVAWGWLALSVVSIILIWRCEFPWRSRELIGSTLLLLLAVLLVQIAVFGNEGDGPLGYGTAANPVSEIAAIDNAAGSATIAKTVSEQLIGEAAKRPIAFEHFAGLTVSIGRSDGQDASSDVSWTAYSLHAPMTGMLAALVSLPLFAFARARGVRWFGLIFLIPIGVVAPYTFLALANGAGSAIATVPMFAAAAFSLLVSRRDRGWWALALLFSSAIAVTAGPMALIPIIALAAIWVLIRSSTYEHLAQVDKPVSRRRSMTLAIGAISLGVVGSVSTLATGSGSLAWKAIHEDRFDTFRSWPFAWLDTDLSTAGPIGTTETIIWLAGPLLLILATIHAVKRNEKRELAVLVGAVVAAFIAIVVSLGSTDAGIRLYEYVILMYTPLLAALAVRAVSLTKEATESAKSRPRFARYAASGPALLATGFVILSLAATTVTGTRMVHAPALASVSIEPDSTLIAGGDPWLEFVIDGERTRIDSIDADDLASKKRRHSSQPINESGYKHLVLNNSPLSSDPAPRFVESTQLDSYQARLFIDRTRDPEALPDARLQAELSFQHSFNSITDETKDSDAEKSFERMPPVQLALRHDPVEGADAETRPDEPAGLMLPVTAIPNCTSFSTGPGLPCEPQEPITGESCGADDVAAVRSPIDRRLAPNRSLISRGKPSAGNQLLHIDADSQLPQRPPLLGVQCFDVALDGDAGLLLVHTKNVGHILDPQDAETSGEGWKSPKRSGRLETNTQGARITFGGGSLVGPFDLIAEGSFGAGAEILGSTQQLVTTSGTGNENPSTEIVQEPIATLRGSADGFGTIARSVMLTGSASIRNSSGTDISVGRLFARPRDLPPACDIAVPLKAGMLREIRLESADSNLGNAIERPGLTVAIVAIEGSGENRTARVAVGSYLAAAGMARSVLVDWTEQYEESLEYRRCDGTIGTERAVDKQVEQVPLSAQALAGFGRP